MATLTSRLSRPATSWAVYWSPRTLHPMAWWLWALGLTVAASRTTNPLLLGTIIAVASWVVMARRSDGPWAQAFRLYVMAAVFVVVLRVLFRVIFGGGAGETVLVSLPEIQLPEFAAGIQLFGDVTVEALLAGFYDGLRLGTMLICLGAANALANPRRLLRSMPPALHEISTAVVVSLSVFPQLAESVVRVTRARRLRPGSDEGRVASLRGVIVPVLEDALDRSLLLAASMDARGYGRSGGRSRLAVWGTGGLLVTGLAGMCVGVYALLDATTPRYLAMPFLLGGIAVGVVGIVWSGSGVRRTKYRPDRWLLAEIVTVLTGVTAAVLTIATLRIDPTNLIPSLDPLAWPQLPVVPMVGVLIALLPAFITPPPVGVESGEWP